MGTDFWSVKRGSGKVIELKTTQISELRGIILRKQNGRCLICGEIPDRPCLDHEHKKGFGGSGLIRGVLCHRCNSLLSKSENNCRRFGFPLSRLPFLLRAMADYIELPHYPYLHPSERDKPQILMKSSYNKLYKAMTPKERTRFPYPKSGRLTKDLQRLFKKYQISPKFYKNPLD